ncbi:MAG: hypothetical protein FP824_03815 [Euryarchaeota archaeon]|nr:hypothetical protein [Euryarchaeota archaeon]MBU4031896.1 hypothetical protein [Candidatus Thermoplasmatota archaeon]MBU4070662.1 hypothetical protein [Candidatus Thermoplasmatota archaeon]MBU4143327.1 hypothetical protein [Candidatus Thermoplasmatota archaeon]
MEGERGNFEEAILHILFKWDYRGVTREIFYNTIPGLKYQDLKNAIESLEKKVFVEIEWMGPDQFMAYITELGIEHLNSLNSEIIATKAPDTVSFEKMKALTDTKCKSCMGTIRMNMDMIKCSCGRDYHVTCGERFGKCPNCDVLFTVQMP